MPDIPPSLPNFGRSPLAVTASGRKPTPLESKVAAAQLTLDRFKDQPFKWGQWDCTRMVAYHLRKLGHKVKMPPAGSYRTERSAKVAMKKAGFENLAAAVDALGFERIAPAATIAGDIVMLPSEDEDLGALGVQLGNGRTCGYHPDAKGASVLQPSQWSFAWRVMPK